MAQYSLNIKVGGKANKRNGTKKADSAKGIYDYVMREGRYEPGRENYGEDKRDKPYYFESGNMPSWAQDMPRDYWKAADKYERDNGRLFVAVRVMLPRELTDEQNVELAKSYAHELVGTQRPYTFAVHTDDPGNPHMHLVINERVNDGIETPAKHWFKKADKRLANPGKSKILVMNKKSELNAGRKLWADLANDALTRAGFDNSHFISEKTLYAQGKHDKVPQPYIKKTAIRKSVVEGIKRYNALIDQFNTLEETHNQLEAALSEMFSKEATEKPITAPEKITTQPPLPDLSAEVEKIIKIERDKFIQAEAKIIRDEESRKLGESDLKAAAFYAHAKKEPIKPKLFGLENWKKNHAKWQADYIEIEAEAREAYIQAGGDPQQGVKREWYMAETERRNGQEYAEEKALEAWKVKEPIAIEAAHKKAEKQHAAKRAAAIAELSPGQWVAISTPEGKEMALEFLKWEGNPGEIAIWRAEDNTRKGGQIDKITYRLIGREEAAKRAAAGQAKTQAKEQQREQARPETKKQEPKGRGGQSR